VCSVTTRYTQDLASPLSQILSDGTTTSVYGMDRLYGVAGGTRTWYASDALGSVRQTLTDSGSVLGAQHFDPWGQPQRATIAPFGFTGEVQQGASVYLRARWYNAGSGSFGSRDSFAGRAETPNTLAPYTYAANSPVMLSDPSGRCYAPIAFLRDVEPLNCSNLDAALRIAKNPHARSQDRLAADGYIVAFAFSHAAALVGAGVLAGSAASGTGALITAVSQWGSAHILAGTGVGSTLSAGGTVLGIAGTADTLYQASQGDPMAQAFLACPGAYGAATLWNEIGSLTLSGMQSIALKATVTEAQVGIIVRPRGTLGLDDAGHFAVYTDIGGDMQVRGYWPQERALPNDDVFDFLFKNRVPGEVRNDINILQHIDLPQVVHARRVVTLEQAQELRSLLGDPGSRSSYYSFNPDNFSETFNCVTWGCSQFNQALTPAIPSPRQGRIRLALPLIDDLQPPWMVTVGK